MKENRQADHNNNNNKKSTRSSVGDGIDESIYIKQRKKKNCFPPPFSADILNYDKSLGNTKLLSTRYHMNISNK